MISASVGSGSGASLGLLICLGVGHCVKCSVVPFDNLTGVRFKECSDLSGYLVTASVLMIAQKQSGIGYSVVNAGGFLCFLKCGHCGRVGFLWFLLSGGLYFKSCGMNSGLTTPFEKVRK